MLLTVIVTVTVKCGRGVCPTQPRQILPYAPWLSKGGEGGAPCPVPIRRAPEDRSSSHPSCDVAEVACEIVSLMKGSKGLQR